MCVQRRDSVTVLKVRFAGGGKSLSRRCESISVGTAIAEQSALHLVCQNVEANGIGAEAGVAEIEISLGRHKCQHYKEFVECLVDGCRLCVITRTQTRKRWRLGLL